MPELVGLGDRDVLLLGVDDEDRVGQRVRPRMPPRLRCSFSSSRLRMSASFLGMASKSPASFIRSYSCIFLTRALMVWKLVSIPPSQRSFT